MARGDKPVLEARGLTKRYGKVTTVHDVDIKVYPGEIVGLLGANGAGKTTSFHMICGLTKPTSGQILLDGKDVTRWTMSRRCKAGLGYLPQEHSLFGALTVDQNLCGALEFYGVPKRERRQMCEDILKRFDLWDDPVKGPIHNRVVGYGGSGGLSGGERRRLEFARAVAGRPKILMLDEPFAACDPETISKIQRAVLELADSGIAVLINDHAIANTLKITARAYVIDRGSVLCSGSAMDVLCNPDAIHYYFTHEARDNAETIGRAHGLSPEEARERVARAIQEVERRWPDDVISLSGRGSGPAPTDDDYGKTPNERGRFGSRFGFSIGDSRRDAPSTGFRPTERRTSERGSTEPYGRSESSERPTLGLRRRNPSGYDAPETPRRYETPADDSRESTRRETLSLRRRGDDQERRTSSPRNDESEENRYFDKTRRLLNRRRPQ